MAAPDSKRPKQASRRVGVVGYGALGKFLVNAILAEGSGLELAFVWNRTPAAVTEDARVASFLLEDLREAGKRSPDLIVEVSRGWGRRPGESAAGCLSCSQRRCRALPCVAGGAKLGPDCHREGEAPLLTEHLARCRLHTHALRRSMASTFCPLPTTWWDPRLSLQTRRWNPSVVPPP